MGEEECIYIPVDIILFRVSPGFGEDLQLVVLSRLLDLVNPFFDVINLVTDGMADEWPPEPPNKGWQQVEDAMALELLLLRILLQEVLGVQSHITRVRHPQLNVHVLIDLLPTALVGVS